MLERRVFRFNFTKMASRTLQSQRPEYDHSPSWTYFLFLQFSPSNPGIARKQAWLGGYGRASRVLRLVKGTRETQRRIQEDAGRRNSFHLGQQRNHDFHRVSNSAHGRAHARSFSSVTLRRPLNLYRNRDDRNKVRVHPVGGDFRGEMWKCDYVAGPQLEIWNWDENWYSERNFIYVFVDKIGGGKIN